MGKVIATFTSEIKRCSEEEMSIRSVLSGTMESRVTPMRANGTVRSAFFHMTGFRIPRAGRRSGTARSVKNLVVEGIDFKDAPDRDKI